MADIEVVDLTVSSDEEDETMIAIDECLRDCSALADDEDASSIYSVETLVCKEEPKDADDDEQDATLQPQEPCATPSRPPPSGGRSDNDHDGFPAEADVGAEPALPLETSGGDASAVDTAVFDDGRVSVMVMPRDGDCFYRACLHQRRPRSQRLAIPTDEEVAELRASVAEYMEENRGLLAHFFPSNVKGQTLSDSISRVKNGDWGDQTCINAVANLWCCPIEVYTELGALIAHFPGGQDSVGLSPNSRPRRPLRLAYRCWDDGEALVHNHFDSVQDVILDASVSKSSQCWSRPASPTPPPDDEPHDGSAGSPSRGRGHRRRLCSSPRVVKRLCSDSAADEEMVSPLPSPPPAAGGPPGRPLPGDAATPPLARVRAEDDEEAGAPRASQELVEPSSPTPGLVAPGSPSVDVRTASQANDDEKDADSDSMERLMAGMFSPAASGDTNKRSSCASKSPSERGRIHLAPLLESEPRETSTILPDFDVDELSTSQKTREWLRGVPCPPCDDPTSNTEDLCEAESSPILSSYTTCDMMTNISTIYDDSLQEFTCEQDLIKHHHRKTSLKNGHRTVATNVRYFNNQLVGTFQVYSTN